MRSANNKPARRKGNHESCSENNSSVSINILNGNKKYASFFSIEPKTDRWMNVAAKVQMEAA